MNKQYKYCIKLGPGGVKCPCCSGNEKGIKRRINRKFRRAGKKFSP